MGLKNPVRGYRATGLKIEDPRHRARGLKIEIGALIPCPIPTKMPQPPKSQNARLPWPLSFECNAEAKALLKCNVG